jgi:hypothetical protein
MSHQFRARCREQRWSCSASGPPETVPRAGAEISLTNVLTQPRQTLEHVAPGVNAIPS